MIKKIVVLLICVVLLSTVVATSVSAASPLRISKYDITDTSVGARIAQEAVQRWQSHGWNFNGDVKVYKLGPGDYYVAPASAKIELESVKQPDGSVTLEPRMLTGPRSDSLLGAEALGTEGVSPMGAPYWYPVEWYCDARQENFYGWLDQCYQLNKLMGETDYQRDYYALKHWATAASKYFWRLKSILLSCEKREGSSTME